MKSWISQEEACEALGVRKQTLYAYVSRGQIEVRKDPAHVGRNLYRGEDIAALLKKRNLGRARKNIAASTMAWGEPIISTHISTIARGHLYYRGKDAVHLAESATLEQVAQLLWETASCPRFPVMAPVSLDVPVRARVYATLGVAAANGAPGNTLTFAQMCAEGAELVGRLASGFVDFTDEGDPLHVRIARAWGCVEHADLLRRTLVLRADQELTSSSFAARVTASTGATLGASVLAGLMALSGPVHGGAIAQVQALFDESCRAGVEAAVNRWMTEGGRLPGFDHELYPEGDPRAAALLSAFPVPAQMRAIIEYVARTSGLKPNIDAAMVALAAHEGLPEGAAFALFAIGRSVGWMAHVIEQISAGSHLRPRAHYVGPAIAETKGDD